MATTVQHRRSETTGSEPAAGDILVGELAVNLADGKLFSKKTDGTIVTLAGNLTATTYYIPTSLGYITETPDFGTDFGLITASVGNGNTQETNTTSDVTFDSVTANNNVTVTYSPPTTTGAAITVTAKDTQGGVGWADFLKVTTSVSGATNPSKWFRLSSAGGFEIVNNAYSATILSLTDAGTLNVNQVQVGGAQAVNGPAFSVYRSSSQSIPTDALTRLEWTNEEYDTAGCMTSTRFTPNVAGYYSLVGSVRFDGDIGTGERMISIKKNGAEYRRGMNAQGSASVGTGWFQMEVSCQVYANGTTDYFELFAQHGAGANRNTTAGQPFTAFQGCMLRGA